MTLQAPYQRWSMEKPAKKKIHRLTGCVPGLMETGDSHFCVGLLISISYNKGWLENYIMGG
jgi:hypothetical protein